MLLGSIITLQYVSGGRRRRGGDDETRPLACAATRHRDWAPIPSFLLPLGTVKASSDGAQAMGSVQSLWYH